MTAQVRANTNTLDAPTDPLAFRRLAENIPALCWIADESGYVVWYNSKWYDYTGKTPAEMRGWGWRSVHEPDDLPQILEQWMGAISSSQPFEMVIPIRGCDGVVRPFLTRINPAFDEKGAVTNWYGVNFDISRQQSVERALAESEARFRLLADTMPQMVWSAPPSGIHDYHNLKWCEFTGNQPGSVDRDLWLDLVHPDDKANAGRLWRSALQNGEPYQIEHRLRDASGAYRWVLSRALAERDAEGLVRRWYGTWTDIEDLVRARAVLQRSRDELEREVATRTGERNLLATLVETTDIMVTAIDLDHNIVAINRASAVEFNRLYGVLPKVGDNVLKLLSHLPECQAAVREAWRPGLSGLEVVLSTVRGDPARARSHCEVKICALRDAKGILVGAFEFAQDISARVAEQAELAQAQAALLQSQKLEAMGQLTGGVAHDFNNLLTPILGSLDMLQRRGVGGEREQRLIFGAYQSAERAKVLVHRLLAFARRQPLQSAPLDVTSLVKGLADLVDSTIGPQITLEINADQRPHWAKADAQQLELAILNLCVNARDAIEGAGWIKIAVTGVIVESGAELPMKPGRYIQISIRDNGVGMDEQTRTKAIEPFFSSKGPGKGTGLGLSMAHGLAVQLGGGLMIESAPGQGAEVSIWLPQCPPAGKVKVPEGQAKKPSRRFETALLVDDEEHIRVSTADMLTEMGFKVMQVSSAEEAMTAIGGGLKPDILITDHLMTGMTGVELAKQVQMRLPDTKLLLVSGFAEVEGVDKLLRRLTKPFVKSDLERALATL